MAEHEKSPPKRLIDRAREVVRDILEAVDALTRPAPVLVPVRARRR